MIARLGPGVLALLLCASGSAAAELDANGKWRFNFGGPQIVTVTQSGDTVSFSVFSGSLSPAGAFTSYSVTAAAPFEAGMSGRFSPSGNVLDGRLVVASPVPGMLPTVSAVVGTRCECDDGNTADGDGCDATCRVEPCWTCSGDPSTCSPTADGGACEDGSPCTTGETCTAGLCTGGLPVEPPCTDMTGAWIRHTEIAGLGIVSDTQTDVIQRGTDLFIANYVGAIDPATGEFDLRVPNLHLFCFGFDTLIGSVGSTGLAYTASGVFSEPDPLAPDQCLDFALTETGTRCGNGRIDLTEPCDDGNPNDGDGCSASCQVEPCYSCPPGEPCAIQPRPSCRASTAPAQSALRLRNVADDARDALLWVWNRGAATERNELGDPVGGSDGYALCLYEDAGAASRLLFRAAIDGGGGDCGGRPCWSSNGRRGLEYRNRARAQGIATVSLRSGPDGTARVAIKGRGAHLSDRPEGLPALPLPVPLRVQLHGSNGLCVETRHTADSVVRNDPAAGVFKAVGSP